MNIQTKIVGQMKMTDQNGNIREHTAIQITIDGEWCMGTLVVETSKVSKFIKQTQKKGINNEN